MSSISRIIRLTLRLAAVNMPRCDLFSLVTLAWPANQLPGAERSALRRRWPRWPQSQQQRGRSGAVRSALSQRQPIAFADAVPSASILRGIVGQPSTRKHACAIVGEPLILRMLGEVRDDLSGISPLRRITISSAAAPCSGAVD
jgi:hypothetical protein